MSLFDHKINLQRVLAFDEMKERYFPAMNNISDKKIRFTEHSIEYKKGFKWRSLPYTEVIQAYMRIEEVNSKMCCGTANFDMHFLMLKIRSGELLKISVTSRTLTEQMLEALRVLNPGTEIGYKKNSEKDHTNA